jgi:allophanate hydrolase subunit 2
VLVRRTTAELPPEGLLPGAVQVPPSGQPIVFLVDHPVTGGYPVIGVVERADLRVLAQTRPGGTVTFTATW